MEIMKFINKIVQENNYYSKNYNICASSLSQFPILKKIDVIKNYNDILKKSNDIVFFETSGSTGIPLKIAWKLDDYINSMMTLWRLRKKNRISVVDFFLTCHGGISINNNHIDSRVFIAKNYISLSKMCCSPQIMKEYIYQIKMFSPSWIYAQPSFVYYLGNYIHNFDPQVAYYFKYIELVGEMLTPEIKNSIQSFFPSAKIINMYGMQEFNGIMYEQEEIFRPIEDNVYIEIVNKKGEICNENEEGRIIITGLKNTVFPLIRYETGDYGKMVVVNNRVGYIITSGRSNDPLIYQNRRYDGSVFFLVVNEYNKLHKNKIVKFQVIYEGSKLIFQIFSFDDISSNKVIEYDLCNIIYKLLGIKFDVNVEITASFSEIGETKTKYFINKTLLTDSEKGA